MPRHQTPAQRETVERVMHEFKHGELKTAHGKRKVKNPKQAIAIALHEAGASKYESPAENKRNLRRTKAEGAPRRARPIGERRDRPRKDQGRTLRGSEEARHPGALEDEQAAARTGAARADDDVAGAGRRPVLQVREPDGVAIGAQSMADPHLAGCRRAGNILRPRSNRRRQLVRAAAVAGKSCTS